MINESSKNTGLLVDVVEFIEQIYFKHKVCIKDIQCSWIDFSTTNSMKYKLKGVDYNLKIDS